ncbi:P-selectin-like [Branchiostoma floridae]|uniref:P-selectin-like n=1 Tax=Branchiostoma floridae TaxID=7739 RepID=A0A9J7HFS3_BRAFL|nr:P-selectin-like [Branchiostoma floridae]
MMCDRGSYFRYPEICNFACDRGYELTLADSREIHCQTDATWSGNNAECIAVKCPDLSSPMNGRMACNSGSYFRYPEVCNFACNPGYKLTPTSSSARQCQADATWSGNNAECIGVQCPALFRPTNGRMSCNHGYSFRHPETCTFTCNHGYHLSSGSSSRTCRADRTWSGSAARCTGDRVLTQGWGTGIETFGPGSF